MHFLQGCRLGQDMEKMQMDGMLCENNIYSVKEITFLV